MTIEISGFNEKDRAATGEVSHVAGEVAVRQGMSEGQVFTTGIQTAEYAVQLTFAALRDMGVIPEEGIDVPRFTQTVQRIVDTSLSPWGD